MKLNIEVTIQDLAIAQGAAAVVAAMVAAEPYNRDREMRRQKGKVTQLMEDHPKRLEVLHLPDILLALEPVNSLRCRAKI
jgi:hypothetical protein